MINFDLERPQDSAAVEALLDVAFGPDRAEKSSSILREQCPALPGTAFVARHHLRVVGTVRLTPVHVHDPLFDAHRDAFLLGPLAVDPTAQCGGIGSKLMEHALMAADSFGLDRVLLVGDLSYYQRFGFQPVQPRVISMPGGKDADRLLVRQAENASPLPSIGSVEANWISLRSQEVGLQPAA